MTLRNADRTAARWGDGCGGEPALAVTRPTDPRASDAILEGRRTLIATRGLPAAGKTTAALRWVAEDPKHRARVGSDEIAAMLHPHVMGVGAAYGPVYADREQLVVDTAIEVLLRSGIDVVCDDPFLLPQYLDAVRELARRCNADLVIWDLTDVDVDECIARDEQRGRAGGLFLGAQAIRTQAELLRHHQPPLTPEARPVPAQRAAWREDPP